jgi:hypothetical protein
MNHGKSFTVRATDGGLVDVTFAGGVVELAVSCGCHASESGIYMKPSEALELAGLLSTYSHEMENY